MLRQITLSVFAIAVTGMAASAADLPAQSRLGAVFAEPDAAPAYAYRTSGYWAVYAPRSTSRRWSPAIMASRTHTFTARITAGRPMAFTTVCPTPAAFMAIARS